MLDGLNVVYHMLLPPEGTGTVRALSRIGYELPAAIADLVDNSIDASASRVEITFLRDDDEIIAVTVADDGKGMDSEGLRVAMQFAGKTSHRLSDLGTYGMGLKSASFSQCNTLTVVSRRNESTVASRWSAEEIDTDWKCEILDPDGAKAVFEDMCMKGRQPTCGTLVIWQRLDRLSVGADPDALNEFLNTALPRLTFHLGLIFHRFLENDVLAISIVVRHTQRSLALPRNVRPINPFGYRVSAAPDYPKTLRTDLPSLGSLELEAHIWPDEPSLEGFSLGGKRSAEWQGFYFYRNNRLIQAGGWNGVIKNNHDTELSLARIAVDLPPGGVDVNVQKSALQVTAAQAFAFLKANDGTTNLSAYIEEAKEIYRALRRRNAASPYATPVPSNGLPVAVRKSAERRLSNGGPVEKIAFVWQQLDASQVFDIDAVGAKIILNSGYRKIILGEASASGADIPFLKMLLFLVVKDEFGRSRSSRKQQERLDLVNALMLDIVKSR